MSPTRIFQGTGTAAYVALALLTGAPPAGAAEPIGAVTRTASAAQLSRLTVVVNKSRTQRLSFPFQEILVGQPDIADVIPVSDQTLYILGKRVGTTSVSVFNAEKQLVGVIDLTVNPETVSGLAPDAVQVEQAVSMAAPGTVNNTVVKNQQVMLQVRIAEINRTAARALGIRYDFAQGTRPPPARVAVGGGQGPSTLFQEQGLSPYVSASFGVGNVNVFLEALENRNLARNLAEPNLTALTGETASFLAGGEYPIVTVEPTAEGGFPRRTVTYKPFGVRLEFTPTVLQRGVINLRVTPSVSEISGFDPNGIAIFRTRTASTMVELRDGQSFAMAGLLQANSVRDADQVPWLGSIPVIGALFRSTSFQNNETELVVIVTPHLVKPAKPGQQLRIPQDETVPANDVDQFLVGDLEVKKRPAENGTQRLGQTRGQYGHILTPRPPVVKVPVVTPSARIAPKPVAKPVIKTVEPVATGPAAVVVQ